MKIIGSWWLPLWAAFILCPINCARYARLVLCKGGAGTDEQIIRRAGVANICGESSVVWTGRVIVGVVLGLVALVAWRKGMLHITRRFPPERT